MSKEDFINTDKKKPFALESCKGDTSRNSGLGRPVFPESIESQIESTVNIYQQLASIPREIADKITNAKTGGGRSLNAIHTSKKINASEKHLLLVLANEMDFTASFEYQYKPISINYIAEMMSVDRKTVMRTINGRKENSGLVINGYLIKIEATIAEQQNGYANNYCLTSKIFDEYMRSMINGELKIPGVSKCPRGMGQNVPGGWDTVGHNIPITPIPPILNAAAEKQTAAVKRCRPLSKSKMKLWDEKSESEKSDTIFNMTFDAHLLAVKQRQARPFPRDDMPDLLKPMITGYGIQKMKDFFDRLKNEARGCDVRKISLEMDESVSQMTKKPVEIKKSTPSDENIHQDQINSNESKNFTDEILAQVETNMMYANNLSKTETLVTVKTEDFPLRLKKFYDSINSKIQKRSLIREISTLGLEKYLQLRATAILKCSYDDLFVEQQPLFAQF